MPNPMANPMPNGDKLRPVGSRALSPGSAGNKTVSKVGSRAVAVNRCNRVNCRATVNRVNPVSLVKVDKVCRAAKAVNPANSKGRTASVGKRAKAVRAVKVKGLRADNLVKAARVVRPGDPREMVARLATGWPVQWAMRAAATGMAGMAPMTPVIRAFPARL